MKKERFEELDFIRGLAVVLMIVYHVIFDLHIIGTLDLRIGSPFLEIFADVTAGTFFSVVGVSLYISFARTKAKGYGTGYRLKKYFTRGAKLLGWGLVVTVVTYFIFPDMVILFGALHFIGISVIFGYVALEFTADWVKISRFILFILVVAAVFLISGPIRSLKMNNPFLLWLGLAPSGFQSLDYFPIFPWFGLVVSGLILGEILYPHGARRWDLYRVGSSPLEFMGRHALVFYFLHQPLIYLGILFFIFLSEGTFSLP